MSQERLELCENSGEAVDGCLLLRNDGVKSVELSDSRGYLSGNRVHVLFDGTDFFGSGSLCTGKLSGFMGEISE